MKQAPKIETHYERPPISTRAFDWSATLADYDPGEPDESGVYHGGGPIGHGATEADAIADLMQQIED